MSQNGLDCRLGSAVDEGEVDVSRSTQLAGPLAASSTTLDTPSPGSVSASARLEPLDERAVAARALALHGGGDRQVPSAEVPEVRKRGRSGCAATPLRGLGADKPDGAELQRLSLVRTGPAKKTTVRRHPARHSRRPSAERDRGSHALEIPDRVKNHRIGDQRGRSGCVG
jgi:hypothetical protein